MDFQAPDKMYTKGHADCDDRLWSFDCTTRTDLDRKDPVISASVKLDRGFQGDVESSVDPEQLNPLNVLLDDSQIVGDLELEVGALLNGEEMFKVSWLAPTGIDLGFGRGRPNSSYRILDSI